MIDDRSNWRQQKGTVRWPSSVPLQWRQIGTGLDWSVFEGWAMGWNWLDSRSQRAVLNGCVRVEAVTSGVLMMFSKARARSVRGRETLESVLGLLLCGSWGPWGVGGLCWSVCRSL